MKTAISTAAIILFCLGMAHAEPSKKAPANETAKRNVSQDRKTTKSNHKDRISWPCPKSQHTS